MATTITVSGNGSSGPYDVSAIDWHPYGLLQQQATVFRLDATGSASTLTFGDDYTFNQNTKGVTLTDTLSSLEGLRVTRSTPEEFFASLPDLGVADAISAKSNDLQTMNRLEEVEARLAEVSGEVSLTFENDAFTSVSAGSNIELGVTNGDLLITSTASGGGSGGASGFTTAVFDNDKPNQLVSSSSTLTLTFDTTGFYGADELALWAVAEQLIDDSALTSRLSDFRSIDIANDISSALSSYEVKTVSNSDGNIGVSNAGGDVTLSYTGPSPVAAPTGSMVMWCGAPADVPSGWEICDGSSYDSVSDPSYAALFAVIGNAFGGGGASNFSVPDMRGNVPVGVNGLSPELGETGGADTLMLDDSQLPPHKHAVSNSDAHVTIRTVRDHGGSDSFPDGGLQRGDGTGSGGPQSINRDYEVDGLSTYTGSTLYPVSGTSSLSQTSMSLMQPYIGVHYIIKT